MPALSVNLPFSLDRTVTSPLAWPSDDELLVAIAGIHVGEHRLCQLANELGQLHDQLLAYDLARPDDPQTEDASPRAEIDWRRDELIFEIDVWVAERAPIPHRNAGLHTETIGAVIDRLAQTQTHASHLLMTLDAADPRVHAAWSHLAELANGYTDLTADILARSRRLPTRKDHR
ncbi:DUF4254 domain-containing protein [Nocardia arthritidis]|uniref:DUF4254 domain-containing protein n=1 Tax=Nocardia arthritidis TaxID=228602 RepID=A0A6G9Y6E7_9NOCA|nr:DUF4254 domain-containing protein [Nocardia arthritidis]QIS08818.1 DUF4254 domain-containing protein [Nocardia arthritidis]